MAQHDMNIANQGFPATRADLNNALQALVSNSSGATAPSTTFANQWWYDTTNNKMYIRNEANNAWIEVAVLDQTNNEWQITTGVVQAKDSDGLALKTDDGTTRLFIKDSDGSIGLGTSSPASKVHISGSVPSAGTPLVQLSENSGSARDGLYLDYTGTTNSAVYSLKIADATKTHLAVRGDGNIGIGVNASSPDTLLHLSSASGTTGAVARLESTDTSVGSGQQIGAIEFEANDASSGGSGISGSIKNISTNASGTSYGLTFSTGNASGGSLVLGERARIDFDGLKFNGDTAAANALDDYEEGTWTPTFEDGAGGVYTGSYGTQDSRYRKIGDIVVASFQISASSSLTANGLNGTSRIRIEGLPFTNNAQNFGVGSVSNYSIANSIGTFNVILNRSDTYMEIRTFPSASEGYATVNDFNGSSRLVYAQIIYTV